MEATTLPLSQIPQSMPAASSAPDTDSQSQLQRLQFELARAEAGSRYLAERLPVLVCYAEAPDKLLWVNAAFASAFSVVPSDVANLTLREVLGPEPFEGLTPFIDGALAGEDQHFEVTLRDGRRGPRRLRGTLVPNRNHDDRVVGFVGLLDDLTARAQQEEALRASEGRLQMLADAGLAAATGTEIGEIAAAVAESVVSHFADICIIDLMKGQEVHRVAVQGSSAIAEDIVAGLFRHAPEMSSRSDPTVRAYCGDAPVLFSEDLQQARYGRNAEHQVLVDRIGVRCSMLVRLEHEGARHGVITMCRVDESRPFTTEDRETGADLGRRVAARISAIYLTNELRAANEIKDQVLGLVSHELRTPLTTLKGNASVLRRRGNSLDQETLASVAADVERDAERLHSIVENMLVLARVGGHRDIELEPLLLRRVAQSAVREHAQRFPNVVVNMHLTVDVFPVLGHETYLRQVVTNLLSNATKYSPPGSSIDVYVERRDDEVALLISDRGFGIPEDALTRVFEPFFRADAHARLTSGVGLGLAVCRRLVEEQGGRIWAEAREGGGTTFGCAFPILDVSE